MARYDQNLQRWVATGPDGTRLGTFASQQEAVAAEASNIAKVGTNTDAEFAASSGALAGSLGASSIRVDRPERTAAEIANLERMRLEDAEKLRLGNVPYGTPQQQGGTAGQWSVEQKNWDQDGSLFRSMGNTVIASQIDPQTGQELGPTYGSSSNPTQQGAGGNTNGADYRPPDDLTQPGTIAPNLAAGRVAAPGAGTLLPTGGTVSPDEVLRSNAQAQADIDRLSAVGGFAVSDAQSRATGYGAQAAAAGARTAPQMTEDGLARADQQRAIDDIRNFRAASGGAAGIRDATADTSGADALMRLDSNAPASADRIRGVGADTRGIGALEQFGTSVGGVAGQLGAFDPRQDAINAIRGFADAPRGPSAAEAQLRDQSSRDMANALAIARSARGGPAAVAQALRNAQMRQAEISTATNRSAAIIRAQEEDTFQERRLQALQASGQLISDSEGQRLSALQSQGQLLSQADQQKLSAYQAASAHRLEASQQELSGEVAAGQLLSEADAQKLAATQSAANVRLQGSQINQQGQVAATQAELEGSSQEGEMLSVAGELSSRVREADISVLRSNLDASLQTMALNDQQVRSFTQMGEDARNSANGFLLEATKAGVDAGTAQRVLQLEWGKFAWNQLTDIQRADYEERALQAGIISEREDREQRETEMYIGLAGSLISALGMAA